MVAAAQRPPFVGAHIRIAGTGPKLFLLGRKHGRLAFRPPWVFPKGQYNATATVTTFGQTAATAATTIVILEAAGNLRLNPRSC